MHEIKKSNSDSWDAMFLHYLGVDHIGHSRGPEWCEKKEKEMSIE